MSNSLPFSLISVAEFRILGENTYPLNSVVVVFAL
jgi:hypothetical protein